VPRLPAGAEDDDGVAVDVFMSIGGFGEDMDHGLSVEFAEEGSLTAILCIRLLKVIRVAVRLMLTTNDRCKKACR
jgi:hypothetical protein